MGHEVANAWESVAVRRARHSGEIFRRESGSLVRRILAILSGALVDEDSLDSAGRARVHPTAQQPLR